MNYDSTTTQSDNVDLFIIICQLVVLIALLFIDFFMSFVLYFFQVETAGKMLVFMATQDMVDYHHDLFNSVINSVVKKKILFSKLHGNMTQQERFKIFNDFRQSTSGVLMCTVSSHYFYHSKITSKMDFFHINS